MLCPSLHSSPNTTKSVCTLMSALISRGVLPHLGGPSERERFYLFPDLIPLPQITPNFRRGMQSKSGSWGRFSVLPASAR